MSKNHYQQAHFLLSVAKLEQLPGDLGKEVAIVGRSNAGKSSVLNQITQQKNLARVSKTPGRTQLINIFSIDEQRRLADLPGYGFAKVPASMQAQWQKLINAYLQKRKCLKGVILVMDIRHPFRDLDNKFLAWCNEVGLPVHILLNKVDKLNRSELVQAEKFAKTAILEYDNDISLQTFSALKKIGVKELQDTLDQWFEYK